MSEQTINLVVDKMDQYVAAIQDVIAKHGGDAVNLGLNVVRIDAIQNLFIGFIGILFSFIAYRLMVYLTKQEEKNGIPLEGDEEIGWMGVLILVVSSIISMIFLFNIWNWIGVFWPEAYLVHKFLL